MRHGGREGEEPLPDGATIDRRIARTAEVAPLKFERFVLKFQGMDRLIPRNALMARIEAGFRRSPAVLLLGPRQCGKTTLARQLAERHGAEWFDLEDPRDAARLAEPLTTLEPRRGTVVIDEAQLAPHLFPVLRVLCDRRGRPARFLLLGSASPDLVRGSSESLAGRVAIVPMGGFGIDEIGAGEARRLWTRGGLPRSFLAATDEESAAWRHDFVQLFLERDLRRLGIDVAPAALRRFFTMLAHGHAQVFNASEIGRSLGLAHTTVRRYLDMLAGALVVRVLPPWHENLGKRQVKSPKAYVRDSGLLHSLLGAGSFRDLEAHPKFAASFEGFALEEVLRKAGDHDAYFWSTHAGAEIDLLLLRGRARYGFEFKCADAPTITRSMRIAREDLRLTRLFIVVPGPASWPIEDWVEVVGLGEFVRRGLPGARG